MKKNIIITAALLILVCNTVSAQYDYDEYGNPIYSSRSSSHRSYNSFGSDLEEGWCSIYAEYSPMQLTSSAKGVDDKNFNAATIGVNFDFRLGESPAYLEGAFETTGAWFSKSYDDGIKYSMDLYYSKIPVNLTFLLNLAEGFAIVPFGGLNLKWNIHGEEREKDRYGNTESWRLFDDDYTYGDDYNRLQLGYQAGLRFLIGNCFSIGASWKADITPFCKYYDSYTRKDETEKFKGLSFQLAYCF